LRLLAHRGQEDDRHVRYFTFALGEGKAVHAGHGHVYHDGIRGFEVELLKGRRAARRSAYDEPDFFQVGPHQPQDTRVVSGKSAKCRKVYRL
jgi:hypothetical protein